MDHTDYLDDEDRLLPRGPLSMQGRRVYLFSIENLLAIVEEKQYREFVWPSEGTWNENGDFIFHEGSYVDEKTGTEIPYPEAPLMVDMQSANAFRIIYDAVNEKNKAKLRDYSLEHRGLFVWVMNDLVWPNISFGGSK